jgi:CBS-domain-containing membrane protein
MQFLDRKFKDQKGQFLLQCLLATISVLVVLIILEAIASAAIVAALGATAFIVFAIPKARSAGAKVIIGGYVVGTVLGTIWHWPAQLRPTGNPVTDRYLALACGAVAVGLAILVMAITNTEHPPAVGVALGLAIGEWRYQTVVVIMLGVIGLCVAKWVLREWLKDLV